MLRRRKKLIIWGLVVIVVLLLFIWFLYNKWSQQIENKNVLWKEDNISKQLDLADMKKRDMLRRGDLESLRTVLGMYFYTNGFFPWKDFELKKVWFLKEYLVPTYISKIPSDPIKWKNYYYLSLPANWSKNAWYVLIAEMETNTLWNVSASSIEDLVKQIKKLGDVSNMHDFLFSLKHNCHEGKKCFYIVYGS